jgi:hypothetical protein
MASRTVLLAFLFLLLLAFTAGCITQAGSWSFTINGDPSKSINGSLYELLHNDTKTYDSVTGIPLEIFLAYHGVYPITAVSYDGTDYNWSTAAYGADKDIAMLVKPDGSIYYAGKTANPTNVNVTLSDKPPVSTLDVAPSVLYALDAGGREDLIHYKADKVVICYIDAFGYYRYLDAKDRGLIENISSLGDPVKAICVYPSVTQPNAKSMATGLAPNLVRGDFRSYLPYNDTIIDIVVKNGKQAMWVDGDSPPVYVNDTILNIDWNSDGSKDDEATDAAIREYEAGDSLVVVHFKDTDKVMHDYGPYTPEAQASVKYADSLVGKIMDNLDNGTILIIYADHGCHTITNGGNHGTLLPDDMYIPLIIARMGA